MSAERQSGPGGDRAMAAAGGPLFSRRTLFWLIAIGLVFLLGSMALMIGGDPTARRTVAGAGGKPQGVSALGYRAFVDTLRGLGLPVLVSRHRSAAKARNGVLFIGEPRLGGWRGETLNTLLRARRLIVVLPKWDGAPIRSQPEWVGRVRLAAPARVAKVLRRIVPGARLLRPSGSVALRGAGLPPPTLKSPQLVSSSKLTPVVAAGGRILVGELTRGRSRILLVADPDIFANHGLGKGRNAALAVALVERMRLGGGAVVVDATIHGQRQAPSLIGAMLRQPFAVGTLSLAVGFGVLLWAGAARFGAPRDAPPPFAPGKLTLIDNGTRLLEFGGHQREILARYHRLAVARVAASVHAPPAGDPQARDAWLDRVGAARAVRDRHSELAAAVEQAVQNKNTADRRMVDLARRIWTWKQEMIDGSGGHPGT